MDTSGQLFPLFPAPYMPLSRTQNAPKMHSERSHNAPETPPKRSPNVPQTLPGRSATLLERSQHALKPLPKRTQNVPQTPPGSFQCAPRSCQDAPGMLPPWPPWPPAFQQSRGQRARLRRARLPCAIDASNGTDNPRIILGLSHTAQPSRNPSTQVRLLVGSHPTAYGHNKVSTPRLILFSPGQMAKKVAPGCSWSIRSRSTPDDFFRAFPKQFSQT